MVEASEALARDWTVTPGEILAEALEEREMTQADLARRMGRPLKTINEIVKAKAAVTPETAIQLERALGISAAFWNGLEKTYRESLALNRSQDELKSYAAWTLSFPVKDMIRCNLLPAVDDAALTASLLRYFGVSSPLGWDKFWARGSIKFRLAAHRQPNLPSIAAWVRWGELEAEKISVRPFDEPAFRDVLGEARRRTRSGLFDAVVSWLRAESARCGVAVVVLPELGGARTSGAARWLRSDLALIQVSARYKTADQFWFSFFHEAGHLLTEGKRADVVEEDPLEAPPDNPSERAADDFARRMLMPESSYETFVEDGDFSERSILALAESQGIDPGIVLGRLQKDLHVPPARLNRLKRRIDVVVA
jgi:addiction module HigA family antidote